MRSLILLVLILAGCSETYDLGDEWSPLEVVVERASLPFVSDTATTTVGSRVYTEDLKLWLADFPPGSVKFDALLQHEREHARRQFRYQGLPGELAKWAWIARYLTNRRFQWKEEQRGFYYAITHLNKNGQWSFQDTLRVAANLSGYKTLTGEQMISVPLAMAWIDDVLKGRWKPE